MLASTPKWWLLCSVAALWVATRAQSIGAQSDPSAATHGLVDASDDCLGMKPLPFALSSYDLPFRDFGGAIEDPARTQYLAPKGVYVGRILDTTNPEHVVHAGLRITLCNLGNAGDGFFRIGSPLASHGVVSVRAASDSVIITTISDDGDRIAWSAKRTGHDLNGRYALIRGRFPSRRGTWFVRLAGGQAIPSSLRPWH